MRRAGSAQKISAIVRSRIEEGGERFWRLEDFPEQPLSAVAQTLSRLSREGLLQRLSKGLYYRPRKTRFGLSRPSPTAILQMVKDKKSVFPAGLAAANLLGFSTQAPRHRDLATTSRSLPRKLIGAETHVITRRPPAWQELSEIEAAILDFLRNAGKTSELSPQATTSRMLRLLSEERRLNRLIAVSDTEPPRVRALLGAFAEERAAPKVQLEMLRSTLNPLSRFNFGPFIVLPAARKWFAKDVPQE